MVCVGTPCKLEFFEDRFGFLRLQRFQKYWTFDKLKAFLTIVYNKYSKWWPFVEGNIYPIPIL